MCKECGKRGKTWEGSDPVCAFDFEGKFQDNWNCATLNIIRENVEHMDDVYHSFDERLAVLPYDGLFLLLGWYKNRGRVDAFMIHNKYGEYLDMTDLEICEKIIANTINVLLEGE